MPRCRQGKVCLAFKVALHCGSTTDDHPPHKPFSFRSRLHSSPSSSSTTLSSPTAIIMSFRKFIAAATVVVGMQMAGSSAQSLSSQCQTTLASIVGNKDASCLNPSALVSLAISNSNTSIVPTINTWLTGLCSRPACSNDTISEVVHSVASGCSSDLSSLGLGDVNGDELTSLVQMIYPTVREVVCLSDTNNNNTLCLTETLDNLEPYTGPLTASNIESLVSKIVDGSVPSLPSNVTCTDCTKAAYNIVQKNYGDLVDGYAGSISSTCGASFTDGATPATVSEAADTQVEQSTTTANAAAGSFAPIALGPIFGVAATTLFTAASAFFVLA
ncbi:hypothetical protein C8Q73DRAFT_692621 [Cubamyces lactineus]|nr:hypothetical protein C8Q73DRAFT_692621 [Cubamyces lactineus]